jgi:uncharacterized caspase-like protein
MAKNWAIAIGINQYHFFQPLSCAQADAEALKGFLVTEGGFSPQQCILLTDTSPPFGDRPTIPTKDTILLLLKDLAAACWQPQDRLWFFFSGYGVNYNGKDYLMPVEGNSDQVEETGIEVRSLMKSLQVANLNALILLDINRALAIQAYTLVGQETIELAQELNIPIILSCQPEQFSHESNELGHGFFTAALLEALRSGNGNTLADLERYLSIRTPELCQHHWRPTQDPMIVSPSTQRVILPQLEMKADWEDISFLSLEETPPSAVAVSPLQSSAVGEVEEAQDKEDEEERHISNATTSFPSSPTIPLAPPLSSYPFKKEAGYSSDWHMFLLWGATTMLLICLILVVFVRDQAKLKVVQKVPEASETITSEAKAMKSSPQTSSLSLTTSVEQDHQSTNEPQASNIQSFKNQALLDLAKMSLRQTQASDLGLAIATARKIKPGEPLYEQAQENIKIWTSMILDLAEVRAKQGQYANAMSAAQLITKDDPLYSRAQAAINRWRLETKKYVSNMTVLDAANSLIQPGQASTYSRAIEVAKKVLPGEPAYDEAQQSINQWSQKILEISIHRAAKGEFKAAIETASLVPENTDTYQQAQEVIQKWQKK